MKSIYPQNSNKEIESARSHADSHSEDMSQNDVMNIIQAVFDFPQHVLANILFISKAELYHFKRSDKSIPTSNLNELYITALLVRQNIQIDIKKHLRNVLIDKKTLLQNFQSEWNKESILGVCSKIQEKMKLARISIPANKTSTLEMCANLHRHVPIH